MTSNTDAQPLLTPRSYRPGAKVLNETYATMLEASPEAFDCVIYPAKSSTHDEILADNAPVGALLDRDERTQDFDPPILARAMIVPSQELAFDATDSGLYESFHSAREAMTLLLSVPGLRTYTLVEWREYLSFDSEETTGRVVYIAEEKPVGRTLNAQMLYTCYPLPAVGEKPPLEIETERPEPPDPCPENPPEAGLL